MATEILQKIWPEWQIEGKPLGKGSFGVVYKAVRRDHNVESFAAIKVISIPADPSEVDSLRSEGLDMNATRTYLQGIVNDFVSEIQLMESLKGVQNIVSVEDYKVVEKTGEIGWDIYIRMELLTSFNTYICDKKLTEEEVIKLGCDICTALEICGKRNIIHRDIKPENIFINDFGYFKLGDFGIARKMENMTGGLSQKGTFNYMAPEVANSSDYDARVDTYSLGIVLYRLLNGNRLPFLDTGKQLLNPNERRNAVDRRIRGEELPAPCDASPAMADLILRACAYDPNLRFASATEMKQALMSIANGTYKIAASNLDRTTSVRKAPANYDKTSSVRKAPAASNQKAGQVVNTFGSTPKKNNLPKIIAAVLAAVILMVTGAFLANQNAEEQPDNVAHTSTSNMQEELPRETTPPTTQHEHYWIDATYNDPKICAICNETEGEEKTPSFALGLNDIVAKVSASSVYSGDNLGRHGPEKMYDGKLDTNWTEGSPGTGVGEYVTFYFNDTYAVKKLWIYIGSHFNEGIYKQNCRPKTITLTFSDGNSEQIQLEDTYDEQTIVLDRYYYTNSVTLSIDDVYTGTKYLDTVIAELDFIAYRP